MAQRIITVDDLDGTVDAKPVTFALGKETWEIDLTDDNLAKLREALTPFIDKARKVSGPTKKRTTSIGTKAIREWAATEGIQVSARGAIPKHVVDAYNQR